KKDEEASSNHADEPSEAGSSERTRTVHQGLVLRLRSHAQSPGLPARPVSIAIPSGGARESRDSSVSSAGDRALDDEIDSSSRRSRRRVLEGNNSVTSRSSNPRPSSPLRASGEAGCCSGGGEQREEDFEELRRKMAAAEADKVVAQNDLNLMEEKYNREIEGRDRKARRDLHLARVSLVKEYEGVLAAIGDKFEQKEKETAAEILLQETRARIEALTEYSEGGFELKTELDRLKDRKISLEVDYGLALVSDLSLGHLDLPEVSGD
ncbi:hypothetical protein HID58_048062, partial [Brassica napus]